MRILLLNLERARDRRSRMAREFDNIGLPYETMTAIDGQQLSKSDLAQVDWRARRRLGLRPQDAASIGCWLSHRQAMHDLASNGPEMMAIFEDDARFDPKLPAVLTALESKSLSFDVVSLFRGHPARPFVPHGTLIDGVLVGRVRYSESGLVGYVITRTAARHFLCNTRRMVLAVDHALLRYWVSGLNIFHVDPPIVFHGGRYDSQIDPGRGEARRLQRSNEHPAAVLWRRAITGARRTVIKRAAFRRLLRGEIGVTRWSEKSVGRAAPEPLNGESR